MPDYQALFSFVAFCVQNPVINTPVCHTFWEAFSISLIAICLTVIVVAVVYLWRCQCKVWAAEEAEARRREINYDGIAQKKWTGDDYYSQGVISDEFPRRQGGK